MSLDEAPRHVRRADYAQERSERASREWSPWEKVSPEERAAFITSARGWLKYVHSVWRNGWLCVLVRTIETTSLGVPVEHAAIRTATSSELTWKEKQRIKDELFGDDRMAIEVCPRSSELVDGADMYHLWVFPPGYRFSFGLGSDQQ